MPPTEKFIEKFWNNVDRSAGPDACWPWIGRLMPKGYARTRFHGQKQLVHRIAWALKFNDGDLPPQIVRHSCDNRRCCNPLHLLLGTHQDNVDDMFSRGRQPDRRGANNGQAKLTDDAIREIRNQIEQGVPYREIASQFAVSLSRISAIKTGREWSHV